jgi:hypothetical protein
MGRADRDHGGMSAAEFATAAVEPVTATVELVLEQDGVRGVLRAEHTPDIPFSGWLGLAVAVDQCRRSAE